MKKVGWFINGEFPGSLIYRKPIPIKLQRDKPLSNRAVQACPAVNNLEKNYFEIPIPYDLRLRIIKKDGKFNFEIILGCCCSGSRSYSNKHMDVKKWQ